LQLPVQCGLDITEACLTYEYKMNAHGFCLVWRGSKEDQGGSVPVHYRCRGLGDPSSVILRLNRDPVGLSASGTQH
ncbi:MAG: hypothetical protein AAGU11_09300, partial [Syntrophobacteraceae bacterium]